MSVNACFCQQQSLRRHGFGRLARIGMTRTREKILEERRQLKAEYGDLFDSIAEPLFRHDPVGINFEVNPGEYQTEAGSILPRLRHCNSVEAVRQVVHQEFVHSFDVLTAGSEERYTQIAAEIWQLWQASPRL
jgi:hypothetical protein